MPVGAYGGKKEIMDCVSPAGPVYQAGTLSGNPVAMAAGLAMLNYLNVHNEVYTQLGDITGYLVNGIKNNLNKLGINYTINQIGSMFTLFFTDKEVNDFESAKLSDREMFGKYFRAMLERGVYLAPSQFEALFVSQAITRELADEVINTNYDALKSILQKG